MDFHHKTDQRLPHLKVIRRFRRILPLDFDCPVEDNQDPSGAFARRWQRIYETVVAGGLFCEDNSTGSLEAFKSMNWYRWREETMLRYNEVVANPFSACEFTRSDKYIIEKIWRTCEIAVTLVSLAILSHSSSIPGRTMPIQLPWPPEVVDVKEDDHGGSNGRGATGFNHGSSETAGSSSPEADSSEGKSGSQHKRKAQTAIDMFNPPGESPAPGHDMSAPHSCNSGSAQACAAEDETSEGSRNILMEGKKRKQGAMYAWDLLELPTEEPEAGSSTSGDMYPSHPTSLAECKALIRQQAERICELEDNEREYVALLKKLGVDYKIVK